MPYACRPIYAGNAIATVRHTAPGVVMLTVRTTAFEPAALSDGAPAAVGEQAACDMSLNYG